MAVDTRVTEDGPAPSSEGQALQRSTQGGSTLLQSAGIGLYYPYINIREPNWLKAALLYWDSVATIVPDGVTPDYKSSLPDELVFSNDADENRKIRELMKARKLIKQVKPERYRTGAVDRFLNEMLPLLSAEPKPDFSVWEKADRELFGVGRPFGLIHLDKLDSTLYEILREAGYARLIDQEVVTTSRIADAYMIALAAEISTKTKRPAVTDQPGIAACGEYMKFGSTLKVIDNRNNTGMTAFPSAIPSIVLRLNLPFPGPEDLAQIPMEDVVAFHNEARIARQRIDFRQAIETVLKTATSEDDELAQEDVLEEKAAYIAAVLEGQKEALDELGVASAKSWLSIAVPALMTTSHAALTALGVAIAQPYLAIYGTAGVATGGVACYAEWRSKRRDLVAKSPWHYTLTLNARFPQRE